MKTLTLFLTLLTSAIAQTTAALKVSIAGTIQKAPVPLAPFNTLALTSNSFAPSPALLTGLPTVAGGNPAEGYQGGLYVKGLALFTPWQYHAATPHGTLLAYKGGPSGTFHCTSPRSCASNWDFFDLTTLPTRCPSGYNCPTDDAATAYTCGQVVDSAGIIYYMPGAANQKPVMMSFNPNGAVGSGGTPVSNPANYAYFSAPTASSKTPLGAPYGWCTAVFDGRYVYYAPTAAGTYITSTNFLRYDTQAASWPSGFKIANFSHYDLKNGPGGASSCCYLSSAYDGRQNIYLLPLNGAYLTVYDRTASFTSAGSYKVLNMANLGTAGYPQVTGSGNLKGVQTSSGYVGGQMVWNLAGTIEYLYMAPFAVLTGNAQSDQVLQSTVIRVPVATCSPGVPISQTCTGTFTPLDITAASSIWEIFDLGNLVRNPEWVAAGYPYPPINTSGPLKNQLTIGGFQLTWLNVHNPVDPIVGFAPDFGNWFMRHHVNRLLSDPVGWDVGPRPTAQQNGCMGGGYDAANQLFYASCPQASPLVSTFQIGPL